MPCRLRCSLAALATLTLAFAGGCYQAHEIGGGDAALAADAGLGRDVGGDARAACSDESIPAYVGPTCSEAVSACRHACADSDEPCRDACLDDPCRTCFYQTLFACANESGCEPDWRTFACCVEGAPTCGGLQGFDRVRCAMSCPMQFEPYAQCIERRGGVACFMRAAATCNLH